MSDCLTVDHFACSWLSAGDLMLKLSIADLVVGAPTLAGLRSVFLGPQNFQILCYWVTGADFRGFSVTVIDFRHC